MREFYRRDLDTEQLDEVDPNQVIEEVVGTTPPALARSFATPRHLSIQMKLELEENPPSLLSDASELREALTNIIFNSVDAMPQGGIITLTTRSATAPGAEKTSRRKKKLQIEVRDNGAGMDEKVRLRCLEKNGSRAMQLTFFISNT